MAMTCNKARTEEIVELVLLGVPPLVAAEAQGVTESEFVEWMRKGQLSGSGHGNFRQFYEAVNKAEADFEAGLITRIAISKDWKAAAWLAERRFPERYVRKPVGDAAKKPGDGAEADPFSDVDKVVPLKAVSG